MPQPTQFCLHRSVGVDIGSDGVVELGANYEIIVTDEDDDEGDDD